MKEMNGAVTSVKHKLDDGINLIFNGIGLAMGIAVTVLTCLDAIDTRSTMIMVGIGLTVLSISLLNKRNE